MLEKLLGDGSSAETASPGHIPQPGLARSSLLSKSSPAPALPPLRNPQPGAAGRSLALLRPPAPDKAGIELLQQTQPDHSPAASTQPHEKGSVFTPVGSISTQCLARASRGLQLAPTGAVAGSTLWTCLRYQQHRPAGRGHIAQSLCDGTPAGPPPAGTGPPRSATLGVPALVSKH